MALKEYTLILEDIKNETPTISTLTLKFKEEKPKIKTGQYISFKYNNKYKPYSLCSPKQEELIQVCVKKVGECSTWLTSQNKNSELRATCPLGIFTLKKPIKEDIVFLATGSGISPIRAMIKDVLLYTKTKKKIWLFSGNKTEDEIAYKEEFQTLEKHHKNFRFIPVLSRENMPKIEKGHVQDHLETYVKDLTNKEFYLCGVKPMVEAITKDLIEKKIPRNKINTEKFV